MRMHDTITSPTLSVSEAADLLGVDPSTVTRRIHRGEIEAEKSDGSWSIPAAEIERAVARRRAALAGAADAGERGRALARAVRDGYWRSTADVLAEARAALLAFDDFEKTKDAEPVVIESRVENLEDKLEALLDALLRRRGYGELAGDAAELIAEGARLGREAGTGELDDE